MNKKCNQKYRILFMNRKAAFFLPIALHYSRLRCQHSEMFSLIPLDCYILIDQYEVHTKEA